MQYKGRCCVHKLQAAGLFLHCKNKFLILTTEWLPWLQSSWRDSGYEKLILVLVVNCISNLSPNHSLQFTTHRTSVQSLQPHFKKIMLLTKAGDSLTDVQWLLYLDCCCTDVRWLLQDLGCCCTDVQWLLSARCYIAGSMQSPVVLSNQQKIQCIITVSFAWQQPR